MQTIDHFAKTLCPYCPVADEVDGIAIHLIDVHDWDRDHAALWLRDQVESRRWPAVCQCPECVWAEAEMMRGTYKAVP